MNKAQHAAYARARDRVIAAQDAIASVDAEAPEAQEAQEALRAARDELTASEESLADSIEAAWEANRQAVIDAKQAIRAAQQERARVETECGTAARQRYLANGGVGLCVLNEPEHAQVAEAAAAVDAAHQTHAEAQAAFKAGVTAEQLAGES